MPMGDVAVDEKLADIVCEQVSIAKPDSIAHQFEHSLNIALYSFFLRIPKSRINSKILNLKPIFDINRHGSRSGIIHYSILCPAARNAWTSLDLGNEKYFASSISMGSISLAYFSKSISTSIISRAPSCFVPTIMRSNESGI